MTEENPIHILIIEENPDDRASIRRMLLHGSDRTYVFTEAQLGAAGVRAYRKADDTPLDCGIPGVATRLASASTL